MVHIHKRIEPALHCLVLLAPRRHAALAAERDIVPAVYFCTGHAHRGQRLGELRRASLLGEQRELTPLFYLGVAIILVAVFLHPLLDRNKRVQHPEVIGLSEAKGIVE